MRDHFITIHTLTDQTVLIIPRLGGESSSLITCVTLYQRPIGLNLFRDGSDENQQMIIATWLKGIDKGNEKKKRVSLHEFCYALYNPSSDWKNA